MDNKSSQDEAKETSVMFLKASLPLDVLASGSVTEKLKMVEPTAASSGTATSKEALLNTGASFVSTTVRVTETDSASGWTPTTYSTNTVHCKIQEISA